MVAQVAVVNPGFSEALEELAHLSRTIDQAIRQVSLPSLQLPRLPGFGLATAVRNEPGVTAVSLPGVEFGTADIIGESASRIVPTLRAPFLVPPPPGLDSLQALSRSIADALSVTFLPKFDDLSQAITQCCAELDAVAAGVSNALADIQVISKAIEACKSTGVTDVITKEANRLREAVRTAVRPSFFETIIATIIGAGAGALVGSKIGPFGGAVVDALTTSSVLEAFSYYNPNPFEMKNRSKQDLRRLKDLPESSHSQEADSPLTESPTLPFIYFWRTLNSFLEALVRNIESSEDSPEADALRDDSLQVLPEIIKNYEESIQLFKRSHHGEGQNVDRSVLDKAIDVLKERRNTTPTITPDVPPALMGPNSENDGGAPSNLDPTAYSPSSPTSSASGTQLEQIMEMLLARLKEPVRLEIRVLDDRVIARRLDGNRGVSVDMSRGPRLIGYLNV